MAREFKGKSLLENLDDYTIIDIETTGFDTDSDEIIELGALKIRNNKIIASFNTLIQPYYMIDSVITEITGITNEMLKDAPNITEKLDEFVNFIDSDIIVGHNVNFDINFIYDYYEYIYSRYFQNNYVDTLRISRIYFKDLQHHRLSDLAKILNIDDSRHHRALEDCKITFELYNKLKEEINKNPELLELKKHRKRIHITSKDIKIDEDVIIDVSNPIFNKEIVMTGSLRKMTRPEAMQIIANLGGKNRDTVTNDTNYLVVGNYNYAQIQKLGKSLKMKKAEDRILKGQDIEIISENAFYDLLESCK